MKDRGKLNLVVDLLLLLAVAFMAGIGFLMKYTLPPGRERALKYGADTDVFFMGMDRHEWGTIHLTIAYIMIALLAVHVILHWKTMVCLVCVAVPAKSLRRVLVAGLVVLIAASLIAPFVITPERRGRDGSLHGDSDQAVTSRGEAGNQDRQPGQYAGDASTQAGDEAQKQQRRRGDVD